MLTNEKPRIYRLYVKTHTKTGLKYLGRTSREDYHRYNGSGLHWKRHLRFHGYAHTTEILGEFSTFEDLQSWGIYYSRLWDVANSKEWANLCEEDGHGGAYGWKLTFEQHSRIGKLGGAIGGVITGRRSYLEGTHIFALSKEELRIHASSGGKKAVALKRGVHSPEQLEKTRLRSRENNPFRGMKHSKKSKVLMKEWHADKIWVTDGNNNHSIQLKELHLYVAKNWWRGRTMDWRRGQPKRKK